MKRIFVLLFALASAVYVYGIELKDPYINPLTPTFTSLTLSGELRNTTLSDAAAFSVYEGANRRGQIYHYNNRLYIYGDVGVNISAGGAVTCGALTMAGNINMANSYAILGVLQITGENSASKITMYNNDPLTIKAQSGQPVVIKPNFSDILNSTFTATGHFLPYKLVLPTATRAVLKTITPAYVGEVYYCSDDFTMWIATGTTACAFKVSAALGATP